MKYQRLVSNTTPSSLQDWLEEELESRGIDGVYTRYILSLLQQDYLDLEPAECQHTTVTGHQAKKCDEFGCKDYVLSFSKARHQKWKNWEKERLLGLSTSCCGLDLSSNLEERNKIAAVECLKSASEEKFGIEKLIDEVCIKLKNVKTTSEKTKIKEECNDHVEKESEEIPPSSPKDPAEKYYEAFPALNGKTEPMTELCPQQQQDETESLEGVWNGRVVKDSVNQKTEHNETGSPSVADDITENTPPENGKINNCLETHSLKEFKIIDLEDKNKDEGKTTEPSFIVPKMKTSVVRKPFSTGYLPFNQLKKHAQDSICSKDTGEIECAQEMSEPPSKVLKEINTKEEKSNSVNNSNTLFPAKKDQETKDVKRDFIGSSEEARAFESLFENFCDCEKLGILMYAALTDVSNSDLCADEKDKFSVEQLLSKFNSSLASIWKNNGHSTSQKDRIAEESKEVLKQTSDESYSMVYDESVWACNKGEIDRKSKAKPPISTSASRVSRVLSSKENNELYSPVSDIKPLQKNETKFPSESLSKVAEVLLDVENKENTQSAYSPEVLLNGSLQENLKDAGEPHVMSKIEDSLDSYPAQFSPGVENFDEARHLPNIGSERGNTSPKSDEIHGVNAMWKLQDTSHMLDQNLKKIWDPSPLGESSNWLAIPVKNDAHHCTDWKSKELFKLPSHSDVQAHWNQKYEQDEKGKSESLCKGKCTLTYHKGESKFVEVVPSHKQKSAALEECLDTIESSALFQSDSALSSIGYLSDEEYEEEENLLTSPKTHFQPIRHDSLDTDNSDDLEVMMLTHKVVACSPVSRESLIDFNHGDCVPTLPSDKDDNSPKKYGHVEMKKIRGKRISPKNFSTNQPTSPTKEVKRGRTISSSFDELVSLTGRVSSSHDYSGIELASQKTDALNLLSFHFWKADNFRDKGTNTDTPFCTGLDTIAKQQCTSCWEESESSICMPEEDFAREFFWRGCEEINKTPGRKRTVSKWKWSTNDDNNNTEDTKWFPSPYSKWSGLNEPKSKAFLKVFGSNTDINALRQEIKEEEEELFRNISYVNSTSVKDEMDVSTENRNCDFFVGKGVHVYENEKPMNKSDELFKANVADEIMFFRNGSLEWDSLHESISQFKKFYDRSFSLGDLETEDGEQPFPAVPADKILYSSDLEDEWRKTSQSFRIQAPHKRTKYKFPPQKRPCSFYLEGNCRRSDCRFSHDLSTITCRFWEEGTCFKGITCPFLHGYICDMGFSERNSTPDCKYTLESEADFPSLSATKTGAPAQKSNPQEITLDKGNRPKRKKGKSQSSWNPKKVAQPVVSSSWPGCKSFMKTLECSPE